MEQKYPSQIYLDWADLKLCDQILLVLSKMFLVVLEMIMVNFKGN